MTSMQEHITLSDADKAQYLWSQDGLHFGHPLTPLFASYMIPAMTEGTRRAMDAVMAPIKQFICKLDHGYFYQAVVPRTGDPEQIQKDHLERIAPLMGHTREDLARYVDDVLWPLHQEIDAVTSAMGDIDQAAQALTWLQQVYLTFWEAHFRIVLPRMAAGFAFEAIFKECFPDSNSADAYGLLVGEMNKSLESDRALWKLSQEVRRNSAVQRAFASTDIWAALKSDPETVEFQQWVTDFLDVYGWRTVYAHEFVHETWVENPNYCLAVIRGYLGRDFNFDHHWLAVVDGRQKRVDSLLSEIRDEELRARFQHQYAVALEAWPIDEDHHFYIDAMLPARARQLMRKVGTVMAQEGLLTSPDDLFYLYVDEVLDLLNGRSIPDLTALLAGRKAEYAIQKTQTPIPQLGRLPIAPEEPDSIATLVFGKGAPGLEGATREVRGFAASPGRFVGRVRVIHGPEEFFRVQPGDVLVCRSTAPSWTGLFATVGAVVTDSGGILSHASTVAREYGIPCVVGTREATRVFSDGDLVMVDGSQGRAVIDG